MLKILKASAGSGKTYNLAREYIRLILQSDKADAYRHVLAVTFTNKATDEMKRRILQELNVLATNPEASPYEELRPLQRRARQQLSAILHDYSAFAVSTIDRFFQQTLRAFSRELGQFAHYQVQLDREALVAESVDRVLDQLSEQDHALLDWLSRSVKEDLRQNGRFSLEGRLNEVAGSLSALPEGQTFPRERLDRLREACQAVEADFEKQVQAAAQACLDALTQAGVDPAESNRGFLTHLYAYAEGQTPVDKPKDSFLAKAPDSAQWFAKSKDKLRQQAEGLLEAPLQAFLACFGPPFQLYSTARILQGQLYGLGVAEELRSAWTQIQKEKNILSLDDSNTLLRQLIDGTDAPFIYEKMGVRYENFLLDEFQDTADIQWENFRPLLLNSESAGFSSMVVGDVKQSIYRWRGSDWDLLGSRLEQEFREVKVRVLDGNHRTCREIVEFNNAFFPFAAEQLDQLLGEDPAKPGSLSDLYKDVRQQVRTRDTAPGSVEVLFTEDQMGEILQTIQDVRDRGGEWADMAILVRGNAEGATVAAALVEQGIPVVSDDSLFVKSSVTVRRLVSQLSLVDAPAAQDKPGVATYLARSLSVNIPEHYHSLVDLCEGLLRDLRQADPDMFEAEIPYIQAFMDYLQDWVSTGGNQLHAFLRNWEDAQPKIASPQSGSAVRVMTIHKSKGLEFPFVIVPFAEKVTLYKPSTYWCHPAVEGTPLEVEADGVYRVKLDGNAADSLFSEQYLRERKLAAIDNLNVLYVALTRARCGLKVIAAPPPKKAGEYKNLSQVLYAFVGTPDYKVGTPYDFHTLRRPESEEKPLEAGYESFPADSGKRLKFSPEAADYFGPDGSFGPQASIRIRGNVLHGILGRIDTPDKLPAAVEAAVLSGELPQSQQQETLDFLSGRLASVEEKGWFAPEMRVWKEAPVLGPDGNEYRPDRVVLSPEGEVTVIDYKFGAQEESHKRQVLRYANLYRKMGYAKVSAYLWYLADNFIIFVDG